MRWSSFSLIARLVLATTTIGQQNVLEFQAPKLEWQPCGQNVSCVNISVPLNWDDPKGKQVNLFMNKLSRYSNASARVGNLIVNPGGPGGSVHDFSIFAVGDSHASVLGDYFDIIGLDPRGIGYSNATRCDDRIRNETAFTWPENEAEFEKLIDNNKRFAQSCLERTGDLVKHVDTVSVAKDMEAVRIALGGDKLNYYGSSYGTQIAATYASLFPKNIRTMVMDGNLDHTQDRTSMFASEAVGFDASFGHFCDWCDRNKTCSLKNRTLPGSNDTAHTRDVWLLILERADNKTYNFTPNCEPSGCANHTFLADDIIQIAHQSLYSSQGWDPLAQALNSTLDGDFSPLIESTQDFRDQDVGRPPFSTHFKFALTTCLDWSVPTTFAEFQQLNNLARTVAPLTRGRSIYWDIMRACVGWPFSIPDTLQRPLNVSSDVAPILIVQSTFDPATPYQSAVNLQRQIPKSVLLTRKGDGHTSYLYGLEALTKIVDAYFVNGTVPAPNTVVTSTSMGDGFGD